MAVQEVAVFVAVSDADDNLDIAAEHELLLRGLCLADHDGHVAHAR